jgi:two-component system nitrate/nitrite response regulator NarL
LPPIRVLVVDDHRDWRNLVRLMFQMRPEWQVICEVSDGPEAVQKAKELKPDLILLDIGLPTLNGIEAARRIRLLSPNSQILFVSMDNSLDVVQEGLDTGAQGFVYKIDAGTELLPAVEAVLRGQRFVSSGVERDKLTNSPKQIPAHRHEVLFYPDDAVFLASCTRFIAAALGVGNVVAVVVTESHRRSLSYKLKVQGLDVDGAAKHGRYLLFDVAETLSTFIVNDMPDTEQFFEVVGGLVSGGAKPGKRAQSRIAMVGECGPALCAEGKVDAAVRLEQLLNQLATIYDFDLLCAYGLNDFQDKKDAHVFQSICQEHSAVFRA